MIRGFKSLRGRLLATIGRDQFLGPNRMRMSTAQGRPYDRREPDYYWWSKFSVGEQEGYELASAAFARPALSVLTSHIMGSGFTITTGNEQADEAFAVMLTQRMHLLMAWLRDGLALGDSYIVVGPDGAFRRLPPHIAEALVDGTDYSRAIGYRFTLALDDVTITDTFMADGRTMQIDDNPPVSYASYTPGMVPVAHLAWDKVENQLYGRPVYRALRYTFKRYHDILENAAKGVELLGQPVPIFTGLRNPKATAADIAQDREEFSSNWDYSNYQERMVLQLSNRSAYFLDAESDFKFATPGKFASDHLDVLKQLFHNVIEHLRIPEYAWGAAIPSSHASAQAQTAPFVRAIQQHREFMEPTLLHLLRVWYVAAQNAASMGVFGGDDSGAMEDPLAGGSMPTIQMRDIKVEWPPIVEESEEILLKKLQWALMTGLVTRETALRKTDLVEDPAAEIKAADAEADEQDAAQFTNTGEQLPPPGEPGAGVPPEQPQQVPPA